MPRKTRYATPEFAYHVINRGNDRQTIFRDSVQYATFIELLDLGLCRYDVRLYGFCLMPNHFHLVLQPGTDQALSDFMEWVTGQYACTFRHRTDTVGYGHVFQRRFWSAPIRDDRAFIAVLRYVESNPVRGTLVGRAEQWDWSSIKDRQTWSERLSPLPVTLPPDWETFVNAPLPEKTLSRIRRATCPQRGRPAAGQPPI